MFGYVLPRRDRLSEEQQARYRAAYCGLCRCLKKRYGFRARFLVNYDMPFLYFLLGGGEGRQPERCFCPARIVCRKDCMPRDAAMDYAADLSVLLSYWKLRDARQDGKRFTGGAGLLLYRRAYRRAAKRQHERQHKRDRPSRKAPLRHVVQSRQRAFHAQFQPLRQRLVRSAPIVLRHFSPSSSNARSLSLAVFNREQTVPRGVCKIRAISSTA